MIYHSVSSHSLAVQLLINQIAAQQNTTPQAFFNQAIPDHLKNNSNNVMNFIKTSSVYPTPIDPNSNFLETNELYLKDLYHQPKNIINYIQHRASNYNGLSPQQLFDKVPDNLKDNPAEILDFLSKKYGDPIGMEVSHIQSQAHHPHLSGDSNNILLETTADHPNQVRQAHDMTDIEVQQVFDNANQRALEIDYHHTGDHHSFSEMVSQHITSNTHKVADVALSHNYDGLADSIYFGLEGIAKVLGVSFSYALMRTYAPRIIAVLRYIIENRQELIQKHSSREKFVRDYLMPMIRENNADQLGVSFIVGLILACIPGMKALLLAYGLVSLCKLALPYIEKFVAYLTQKYPRLAKLLHWFVGGIKTLVNVLHTTLSQLWQYVEQVANQAWQTVKKGANAVVNKVEVAKDCLMQFFNWSWNKVKGLFNPQPLLA